MSRKSARTAAAIAQALAQLSNSLDRRKQTKRQDALAKLNEQLMQGRLRDQEYAEATRPTIEQKIAATQRDIEREDLSLKEARLRLEQLQRGKPKERRTRKEIAADIGVGDEEQFLATQALEGADEDYSKAIESLLGSAPQTGAASGANIDAADHDIRARARLLLQRERREFGSRMVGSGSAQKQVEAQVDATLQKSVMDATPMALNPNAPFEQKAQAWMTIKSVLGFAPQEVEDYVRFAPQSAQQADQMSQAQGPPAQETRVPQREPRPIRMSATSTADDRAAAYRASDEGQREAAKRSHKESIDMWMRGGRLPILPNAAPQMQDQPQMPKTQRRISGAPYAQPKVGPPYPGVSPEESRQMDLDAIMQSQQVPPPVDPIQVMFDRIRNLRESLDAGRPPREIEHTSGQGF